MVARQLLVILLSCLLAFPAWANANVVGTTGASRAANIRGAALLPGTTIFSGDTVEVGPGGSAFFSLVGGGQFHLAANSLARVGRIGDAIQLEVGRGRASFRTSEKTKIEARLADATIRSTGSKPVIGVIAFLSPTKAVVGAEKGEIVVTTAHDGKTMTLKDGEGVEVVLAPAPATANPQAQVAALGLTGVQIAILAVAVALVTVGVGSALSSAEPNLTDQQRTNAVSPFRP